VHRQTLQLLEDHDAEDEPERADDEADQEEAPAVHPADRDLAEVGYDQARLAAARMLALRRCRGQRVGRRRETAEREAEQEQRNDPEGRASYR